MNASLYRFYNFERGEHGQPFALCSEHAAAAWASVPAPCILEKVADSTHWPCEDCADLAAEEEEGDA